MKKLLIFDLDGTLADTYTAIYESLNFTLEKLGYKPVSFLKAKLAVGRGDNLFIKEFFEDKDIEKAAQLFKKHHKYSLLKFTHPRPYAKKTLYLLKRKKKKIALASNRPTPFTLLILKKLEIKKYIDFVLCADKVEKLKPDPEIIFQILEKFKCIKDEAVFVGDMDIDVLTAHRAGVEAVFIKGGSTPLKKIKKEFKKIKIILNLKELLSLYA